MRRARSRGAVRAMRIVMQKCVVKSGWLLGLWMLVGFVGACAGEVDGESPSSSAPAICTTNQECRGGEACRDGLCRTICSGDADCTGAASRCAVLQGYCVGCLGEDDCEEGSTCEAGQCVEAGAPICIAGQSACSDSGRRVLTCSSDGRRQLETVCEENERCRLTPQGVQCQRVETTRVCTPGSTGCRSEEVAWRCTEDGTQERETPCGDSEVCEDGACVAFTCEPGVERCRGDRVVTCDTDGEEIVVVQCGDTDLCMEADFGCTCRDAFCEERICQPGSTRCQGAATERCASSGLRWEAAQPCQAGQRCEEGACVGGGGQICTPGALSCQGDVLRFCRTDGSGFDVEEDCGANGDQCVSDGGARCEGGTSVCTPNARTCVSGGTAVEVCNASGTATSRIECGSQEVCSQGTCLAGNATCADLDCGAEQRRCIEESPAFCGQCLPGYVERSGACVDACSAGPGEATHVGCDFWPVFVDQDSSSTDARALGIVVTNPSSSRTVSVQVFTASGTEIDSFSLTARNSRTVEVQIPSEAGRGTRRDRLSWQVSANGPVTVHQFNPISPEQSFSNDASLVFPSAALGTDYTVLSWPSPSSNENNRTVVSIVAVETGTTSVEVRPSANIQAGGGARRPQCAFHADLFLTAGRGASPASGPGSGGRSQWYAYHLDPSRRGVFWPPMCERSRRYIVLRPHGDPTASLEHVGNRGGCRALSATGHRAGCGAHRGGQQRNHPADVPVPGEPGRSRACRG